MKFVILYYNFLPYPNFIFNSCSQTPDGIIKLKYWDALLDIENTKGFNLRANYKLIPNHVRPKFYQKMNVGMAFQFFGAADAMKLFQLTNLNLKDSEGAQNFCNKIKALIEAMNSRTPMNALKINNDQYKVNLFITVTKFEIYSMYTLIHTVDFILTVHTFINPL